MPICVECATPPSFRLTPPFTRAPPLTLLARVRFLLHRLPGCEGGVGVGWVGGSSLVGGGLVDASAVRGPDVCFGHSPPSYIDLCVYTYVCVHPSGTALTESARGPRGAAAAAHTAASIPGPSSYRLLPTPPFLHPPPSYRLLRTPPFLTPPIPPTPPRVPSPPTPPSPPPLRRCTRWRTMRRAASRRAQRRRRRSSSSWPRGACPSLG